MDFYVLKECKFNLPPEQYLSLFFLYLVILSMRTLNYFYQNQAYHIKDMKLFQLSPIMSLDSHTYICVIY